ncbi:MAG: outer membrane protein transport protein [Myxococcales bacterium]
MSTRNLWVGRLLLALLILVPCAKVQAGGLYLFDRGARALSRGGAFVAGADDPSSLWYNPAGLKYSGNQVLMDATMTIFMGSFTRYDAAGMPQAKVDAEPMPLPIPSLSMSHNFGLEDWTFAAGIFAPNTILMGWPESVTAGGLRQPAPSRYSLINMRGSLLSAISLGLAYHGIEGLSLGADVQIWTGRFKAKTALSGCDAFACSFPEDPEFDSTVTLDLFPAVGISGAVGFTWDMEIARLGASFTFPYSLHGAADLQISLPTSPLFDNATVKGNKADIEIKFPWIGRVGGEIHPADWLRMEGTFVYEAWSTQKDIPVKPHGVQMQNIRGIGDYDVGNMKIQRNMKDTWSIRGGYEAILPEDWLPIKTIFRGGLAYEKGAFSNPHLTPMTLDTNKVVLTGGFGLNFTDTVRFDTVAGWIFMVDPKVRDGVIKAPAAIRPESAIQQPINNGNYKAEAFYLGGGFSFMLD